MVDSENTFNMSDKRWEELLIKSRLEDGVRAEEHRKSYEEFKKNPERIYVDEDFRRYLYDKGVNIPNEEMSREFYLRERLNSQERSNLLNFMKDFRAFRISSRRHFSFGVFGIGSSVYPDTYYENLKNLFKEKNLGKDDIVSEEVWDMFESDLETYEEYVDSIDDKLSVIVSKERFEFLQKYSQGSYMQGKTVGEILGNQGEDIDFSICFENNSSFNIHSLETFRKFQVEFERFLKESKYDFKFETSFLDYADYNEDSKGEIVRVKNVSPCTNRVQTYRINPKEGRSMHFYVYNSVFDLSIKEDIVKNLPFCRIVRHSRLGDNLEDLEAAILNGEKTGVFENPEFLEDMKRFNLSF